MTKIQTTYVGNLMTEAVHLQSGSKIVTEAPVDNHGKGEHFSPTDMFATSLGCCMLTILGISAQSYGFSIDGTRIETEKIMSANPRRVAELKLDIYFPRNDYTDQQKRLIDAAVRTCPVTNSIHPDVIKSITYHFPEDK